MALNTSLYCTLLVCILAILNKQVLKIGVKPFLTIRKQ